MKSQIHFNQLKRLIEEENSVGDNRKVLIEQKVQQMYNPESKLDGMMRFTYATLYFPREEYGPSEEEGKELMAIGADGWQMTGFQVYTVSNNSGLQQFAEYVFMRKNE